MSDAGGLTRRAALAWLGRTAVVGALATQVGCKPNAAMVGQQAPEFSLADLKGNAVRLANLKGKVVFVNVWATWCEPCRQEMPAMEALYTTLAGPDFEMLAVNSDQSDRKIVEQFVATFRLTFPVLPDPELQVAGRYRVTGYPETFVIDRNGTIVAHELGPRHWDAPDSVAAFRGLMTRGEWAGI